MLAAAILNVVGYQIGSAIDGQIKLQMDFTEDLGKMKMALESVKAMLDDAGRRSIAEKSTRLWLKRLKDAMYAISNMIDEFEADTEAYTQPSKRKIIFQMHLSNGITLPEFSVHALNGESSSNLVLLQHTDPVKLHITRLENVKTAEEAQGIKLIGKQHMTELELQWTRDAERFVDDKVLLEKLVPPSSLEDLVIQGYRSGSFPAWLMDITHYLPNLISIELCNLPNCSVLPPLIQLPNLDCLVLKGLERLEEWNVPYSSGEEIILGIVEIHDCPKLRIKQLPLTANWFKISNSASVLSSWGEYTGASTASSYGVHTMNVERCMVPMHQWRLLQHLTGLTHLEIIDCVDLTGSPEIIQHLSSLKSLELRISGCSGLTELPENMKQLTELNSLEMRDCNNITSLPHWLGELTSLRELEIRGCDGISSLPEGIQQLTNLHELKKWCELEENKVKLAHVKDKVIYRATAILRSWTLLQRMEFRDLFVVGCTRLEDTTWMAA